MRWDGRKADELRPITVEANYMYQADGSVLIRWGHTHILCSAMLEEKTAAFRTGTGLGWLTAEYAMLPASTITRKKRDGLKADGRSVEIKRLIGRALRAVIDFEALGERTVWIDCDVVSADGGTRTASITGAYIALALAVQKWLQEGRIERNPLTDSVAAVSCGIIDGEPRLDLAYEEDSRAEVDCNFVLTGQGRLVEIQGTGEHSTFSREELMKMMELAEKGTCLLKKLQEHVVEEQKNETGTGNGQ